MLSKTLQRYENKSKSQHSIIHILNLLCCLRLCKDTKIKANHNHKPCETGISWLSKTLQRYENKSKSQRLPNATGRINKLSKTLQRYENKSKSQLDFLTSAVQSRCLRLCKDTKIKANHNVTARLGNIETLSKTLQRYENKSKSQPKLPHGASILCCLRLCKDTKIKEYLLLVHYSKSLYLCTVVVYFLFEIICEFLTE